MLKNITGVCYKTMLDYGVANLNKHRAIVNDLNVFPVPDGDTGTNMVMTLQIGLHSIDQAHEDLSAVAHTFANSVVFGARGNSGVIISQFFKGISEGFAGVREADPTRLALALCKGSEYARAAVSDPVEGTILTVMRDATSAVLGASEAHSSVDDVVSAFLRVARQSLENTPNLLPVLAKAGVVDSGGAGLVYFFEGVQRYLNGEPLEEQHMEVEGVPTYVDYSRFNRNTRFDYGYCTELLLQLTVPENTFDSHCFTAGLSKLGESLAVSFEGDKVHVHIHTHRPEEILIYCHRLGEFLSLKIENMSVQHTQNTQKFLCSKNRSEGGYAIVAVAPDSKLQKMFAEMGADVVILSAEVPSSQDFVEAFDYTGAKQIVVFPNCSNSILSAMQAGSLYKQAKVTVLNCRSVAECYASMALIDFENPDVNAVINTVDETVSSLYEVLVVRATKTVQYGKKTIVKNDFFALSGDEVLSTGDTLEAVALQTVNDTLTREDYCVMVLFYGRNISEEQIEALVEEVGRQHTELEVCVIATDDPIHDLRISFE